MVHFVGAGPGAPDLITRRGAALLQEADCIIYAGSLVNPALLGLAKALAQIALEEGGDGGGIDGIRLGGGEQALTLEGLQRSPHRGGGMGRKGDMLHEDMGCGTPLGRGKGLVFQHEGGAALQGGGVPHQGGYGDLAGQAGIL